VVTVLGTLGSVAAARLALDVPWANRISPSIKYSSTFTYSPLGQFKAKVKDPVEVVMLLPVVAGKVTVPPAKVTSEAEVTPGMW
jgi:hypothetical protein